MTAKRPIWDHLRIGCFYIVRFLVVIQNSENFSLESEHFYVIRSVLFACKYFQTGNNSFFLNIFSEKQLKVLIYLHFSDTITSMEDI